ncbi:MAG: glutamate 5-kinase, partial [Flavobacteriaceae bacterium]|nr:glutamate 5-kinase [Flavobacteriaceae bacterium]
STDEIQFGDNDKLAALTACLLHVDLVIFASNTNGIYTKETIGTKNHQTIKVVHDILKLQQEISDEKSSHGSGGMQSKIEAATILQKNNIETWLVNGLEDNFILNAIAGKTNFTKIIKY